MGSSALLPSAALATTLLCALAVVHMWQVACCARSWSSCTAMQVRVWRYALCASVF